MELRTLLLVFGTVFLAELGDKTQIATMLYAIDKESNKILVFIGASLALISTSAIGVLFGNLISRAINPKYITISAGILFILVGCFTIFKGIRAS